MSSSRVHLAGAVPLAPADPLPVWDFAWRPEADTYLNNLNKNRLSTKLNYTLRPSPNTGWASLTKVGNLISRYIQISFSSPNTSTHYKPSIPSPARPPSFAERRPPEQPWSVRLLTRSLWGVLKLLASTFFIAVDFLRVSGYDLALAGPSSVDTCAISL